MWYSPVIHQFQNERRIAMQKRTRQQDRENRRRRAAKRRAAALFFGAIAGAVVLVAVCICLLAPAFDIDNIVCVGNKKISSESIVSAAGIEKENNIFLTHFSKNKKNVEALEYIEDCTIKRVLPDTVKIIVTERQPGAYFSVGDTLVVTDLSGTVVETVNSSDTSEIVAMKISAEEEQEENPEETPVPEEEDDSLKDGTIWGYDDDGDPIYRINGGHYEFDEDGNRYFVNDTPTSTPEPTEAPEEAEGTSYGELTRTSGGTIVYDAPVVYGVGVTKQNPGRALESDDEQKLQSVIEALNALSKAGLLERTTKFDAENPNDIKFYIEDRLEVRFGTFFDFEYKAKFVASVIDNSLSSFETGILDFRDSKLYVRSEDTAAAMYELTEPSPGKSSTPEPGSTENPDDEEDATATPKPTASSTDEPDEEATATPKPTSSADESEEEEGGRHTPTPKVGRETE